MGPNQAVSRRPWDKDQGLARVSYFLSLGWTIFFCCFHLSPGSLWFNFLVNTKGMERTPWVYPFVGEQVSSSSSPGEGKPVPEVVTPAPSRLSLPPAPSPLALSSPF